MVFNSQILGGNIYRISSKCFEQPWLSVSTAWLQRTEPTLTKTEEKINNINSKFVCNIQSTNLTNK